VNHDTLTARYLDEISRCGAGAAELTAALAEMPLIETLRRGRYLPRPVFLGRAEHDLVHADVDCLRSVLASLPDRLFGGDLAAFGLAAGATGPQLAAVRRGPAAPVTSQARADMYLEAGGFRLLEMNFGSPAAGIDCADFGRGLLRHPLLARFAAEHGLGFPDTMRAQVETIFAETGSTPGRAPVLAIAAAPGSYQRLRAYLTELVPRWRELGLDAVPCDVGELRAGRGAVRLDGRQVDIVFRLFMIEHATGDQPARMEPALAAAARGDVAMYTAMDGELLSSKMALAMVSDDRNRPVFSAAELASIDRIVPWTRMVKPGVVTLPDGGTGELMDYAAAHPGGLMLKPAMQHGGDGMVAGWADGMTAARWRDELAAACGGPYVLQRRVRPVPEPMPGKDGELVPWIVTWGVFTMLGRPGGLYIRGMAARPGADVINFAAGAASGCGLAVQAPAPLASAVTGRG
jgi:hypothetical protein